MIARNEAHNLPACLEGLAAWVNEIIVVDTGSTDNTRQVAEAGGARVISFPWCDDFAAARNAGLAEARSSWIMWLDADDRLVPQEQKKLQQLCAQLPDRNLACIMTCRSSFGDTTELADHIRLFRNDPRIRWKFRIHEQILPSIRLSGGELVRTDIVIEHTGYRDSKMQRSKWERNLLLLRKQLSETPFEPFLKCCLARTLHELGNRTEAREAIMSALQLTLLDDPLLPTLLVEGSRLNRLSGQIALAATICEQGLARFPRDSELLYEASQAFRAHGDRHKAANCLLRLIQDPDSGRLSCLPQGARGALAKHNLGVLAYELGDFAAAESWWREVLRDDPSSATTWQGLALLWQQQGRHEESERARKMAVAAKEFQHAR